MSAVQIIFFPGLDWLLDEELAMAYRKYFCQAARDVLFHRYLRQALAYGAEQAWRRGLSGHDIDDAEQQMAIALDEVLTRYDSEVASQHGGYPFRSYLYTLLHNRFEDFFKRFRRDERLINAGVTPEELEHAMAKAARPGATSLGTTEKNDPARQAEWRETRGRIDEVAKRIGHAFHLGNDFHFVLYAMEAGETLHQIALANGFNYDRLKRAARALKACVAGIVN
jgi:DNA-directed RNA polymerase specialized sigma24 family protein